MSTMLQPSQVTVVDLTDDKGVHQRHYRIARQTVSYAKADIQALIEPSGLLRNDGKRPDSVTVLPWNRGKCVTWDVTVSRHTGPVVRKRDVPNSRHQGKEAIIRH